MTLPLEVQLAASSGHSSNPQPEINVVRFKDPPLMHGLTYEIQVRNDPKSTVDFLIRAVTTREELLGILRPYKGRDFERCSRPSPFDSERDILNEEDLRALAEIGVFKLYPKQP